MCCNWSTSCCFLPDAHYLQRKITHVHSPPQPGVKTQHSTTNLRKIAHTPEAGESNPSAHPSDLSNVSLYLHVTPNSYPLGHFSLCGTVIEQNTAVIHLFSIIGFESCNWIPVIIICDFESSYSGLYNDADKVWIWDFALLLVYFWQCDVWWQRSKAYEVTERQTEIRGIWDWAARTC